MIKITLPDGSIREFENAVTPLDVARSISEGLARNTISAVVNGTQTEVTTPITEDATLQLLTWNDDLGKKAFWHSSAHLLAQAIMDFYPNAKLTIGPAIEQGFYYDVDFGDESLSEKDFEKIEKRMLEHAKKNSTFELTHVSKADALQEYADNPYKTELISNLNDGEITFCTHDNFSDLCRGGHIPATGIVKAVKVLNAAGAYWRGDETAHPSVWNLLPKTERSDRIPGETGGSETSRPQKARQRTRHFCLLRKSGCRPSAVVA